MASAKHFVTPVGRDCLDITTWSSEKCKEKSFEEKELLRKEQLEALTEGKVMSWPEEQDIRVQ
jgi:hypothetical protein